MVIGLSFRHLGVKMSKIAKKLQKLSKQNCKNANNFAGVWELVKG